MNKPFIVVLGLSNSGKDTFKEVALANGYDHSFKWVGNVKAAVEMLYDLPAGALEHDHYREMLVPQQDYTFLELLVKLFVENVELRPLALTMFKDAAKVKLRRLLYTGEGVISTDTRQPEEIDYINELALSYPVAVVRIRGRGVERDSDKYLDANWARVSNAASFWVINNNKDVDTFRHTCAIMVSNIESYHAQENNTTLRSTDL